MSDKTEDAEDVQRVVDEAVGEIGERENVVVGEPMSVAEFAEMMQEIKEAHENGEGPWDSTEE